MRIGPWVALALCGALSTAALADPSPDAAREIDHLIAFIRASPCAFIRNGTDHDGAAAADHIHDKYDHFRSGIGTAEDFIARAASKSELSGEPYQVRCPGQAPAPAADWLQAELQAYRAKTGGN